MSCAALCCYAHRQVPCPSRPQASSTVDRWAPCWPPASCLSVRLRRAALPALYTPLRRASGSSRYRGPYRGIPHASGGAGQCRRCSRPWHCAQPLGAACVSTSVAAVFHRRGGKRAPLSFYGASPQRRSPGTLHSHAYACRAASRPPRACALTAAVCGAAPGASAQSVWRSAVRGATHSAWGGSPKPHPSPTLALPVRPPAPRTSLPALPRAR